MKTENKTSKNEFNATSHKNDVISRFLFTPENLLQNLERLGPWSAYGLASEALQYYFPDAYDEDGCCDAFEKVKLLNKLGCQYWTDVIIKYHKEVGYVAPNGFNPDAVNEF